MTNTLPKFASYRDIDEYGSDESGAEYGNSATIALATVLEYAVETYGREHIPSLLAGIARHQSSATLIPDVFDVSLDEYEAGWLAHLAKYVAGQL